MTDNSKVPPALRPRPRSSERRSGLRHEVMAVVEIEEIELGRRMEARVGDLGRAGCYVKAENPSLIGTAVHVHVMKAAQSFQAHARVVYTIPGKGMGLMFTSLAAEDLRIVDTWLEASAESSWLESHRRRNQNLALAVKVQLVGHNSGGEQFRESTQTLSVSPHGAIVLASMRVDKGKQLMLRNLRTEAETECTVAYIARKRNEQYEVGLSFALPSRPFWGVVFPPADWSTRHPDAKRT